MKYGIQIASPKRKPSFCTNKGEQMEFETYDDAQKELQKWLKCRCVPSGIKYSVEEIRI